MLDAEEHRAEQNRKGTIPILDGGFFERADRAAEAGIVVHDVEAAEFLDRAIDGALDVLLAGDIGELENRVAAVLLAIAHRGLAAFLVEVGDDDGRALAREPDGRRASDAARRAGDDRNFLIEFSHDEIFSCSPSLKGRG